MESRDEQGSLIRHPRPSRRLRAPLFDRLTAPGERESEMAEPFRSLDVEAAVESVRSDLQRLLNTRTRPGWIAPPGQALTTVDYGIADFSHISASDVLGRDQLGALMARIIEAFEPRLRGVRVALAPHGSSQRVLIGSISGDVQIGVVAQPVSFPLEVHTRSGDVAIRNELALWIDDGGRA
jgi:type VI secretion system lysozyme-like protein